MRLRFKICFSVRTDEHGRNLHRADPRVGDSSLLNWSKEPVAPLLEIATGHGSAAIGAEDVEQFEHYCVPSRAYAMGQVTENGP